MNRLTAQIEGRKKVYDNGEGSSHSILGFDADNLIIESEATTIRHIFTLFIDKRMSLNKISNELNNSPIYKTKNGGRFSPQTIKRILQRPEYCGMSFNYKKDSLVLSNVYEPIVSLDEWKLANDLYSLKENISSTHKKETKSISGFPKCDVCSSKYYLIKNSYVHAASNCEMSGKSISRSMIDRYVSYVVYGMINDPYISSVVFEEVKEETDIFETVFFDSDKAIKERLDKIDDEIKEISNQNQTKKTDKLLTKLSNSKAILTKRLKRNSKNTDPQLYRFIDYIINQWVIKSQGSRLDVCKLIFNYIYITDSKSIIHSLKNWDTVERTLSECKDIISKPQKITLSRSQVIAENDLYDLHSITQKAIDEEERYLETRGSPFLPHKLSQYHEELKYDNNIVKFFLKNDILASIVDTNQTINMSKIYRINNRGSYFLSYKAQVIKVKLFFVQKEVVFIRINKQLFFNRRFMNILYSINSKIFPLDKKYLRVDGLSLSFFDESNKINCYDIINNRKIDILESLLMIEHCKSFQLIESE